MNHADLSMLLGRAHPLLTRPQRSRSVTARDMPSSPTMGGSDLPRTMARIRRLVRENPNDRELQRLLHSMLTSMTTDKIDEAEVHGVLTRMEQRKDRTAGTTPQGGPSSPPLAMARSHLVSPAPKSPGTAPTWSAALGARGVREQSRPSASRRAVVAPTVDAPSASGSADVTGAASSPSPSPISRPEVRANSGGIDSVPAHIARAAAALAAADAIGRSPSPERAGASRPDNRHPAEGRHGADGEAPPPVEPSVGRQPEGHVGSEGGSRRAERPAGGDGRARLDPADGAPALQAAGANGQRARSSGAPAAAGGGGAPVGAAQQLEAMRVRHEQALATLRQKSFSEARQAQAHHEYAVSQLRRQTEQQLAAAAEAKRAEQRRAEVRPSARRPSHAPTARAQSMRLLPRAYACCPEHTPRAHAASTRREHTPRAQGALALTRPFAVVRRRCSPPS